MKIFANALLLVAIPLVTFAQPASRAFLGIYGEDTDATPKQRGSLVREVIAGSPAQQAGLQTGDLILRAGDRQIDRFDDLANLVSSKKSGDKIPLLILRDGKEKMLEVTLGTAPAEFPSPRQFSLRTPGTTVGSLTARPVIGVLTQVVGDALRQQLGIPDSTGVLIAEVDPAGSAAKAGVQHGDVIVEADGRPAENPRQFSELVLSKKPGENISLTILRGTERLQKKVPVELRRAAPGVLAGSIRDIRSQQVEELRGQIAQLEQTVSQLRSEVARLKDELNRATSKKPAPPAGSAVPAPPAPKIR